MSRPHVPPALDIQAPPAEVMASVRASNEAVDGAGIPAKQIDTNLLIATWNIAHLGRVTKRWTSSADDDPRRTLLDVLLLAQVITRFDVVAIQEVKRDLDALQYLMTFLGPDWGFIVTDVTEGDAGNTERLGYVFDLRRVRPSGLAGELVIPGDELKTGALTQQFARTPFSVSFKAGLDTFTLMTLHILYGKSNTPEARTPELEAFARWLKTRATDRDIFGGNLIGLGDFNIDRYGDANWQAFASTGLSAPEKLSDAPRTVGGSETESFYDQIAWFEGGRAKLTLSLRDAGWIKWTDFLLTDETITGKKARISDHYPLWVEFALSA